MNPDRPILKDDDGNPVGQVVDLKQHVAEKDRERMLQKTHDAMKSLGDSAMLTGEKVRSASEIMRTLEQAIEVASRPPDSPRAIQRKKNYVAPGGKRDRRRRGKAQRQARQVQQRMARAA